jgi:hypothetical protein
LFLKEVVVSRIKGRELNNPQHPQGVGEAEEQVIQTTTEATAVLRGLLLERTAGPGHIIPG